MWALCEFLGEGYDDSISRRCPTQSDEALRDELLSIYGVGDETADDIMLYAFKRHLFVVDAYTRRIFGRMGLVDPKLKYRALQAIFHENIPRDVAVYNEYHGLIVMHAKAICKTRPVCSECPLDAECPKTGV